MLLAILSVAACAEIIPDVGLRDNYMGQAFLQPDKVPGPVARDEFGTAKLEQRREIRIPFLPAIPF